MKSIRVMLQKYYDLCRELHSAGGPGGHGFLFEEILFFEERILSKYLLPPTLENLTILRIGNPFAVSDQIIERCMVNLEKAKRRYAQRPVKSRLEVLTEALTIADPNPFEFLPRIGIGTHVYQIFLFEEKLIYGQESVANVLKEMLLAEDHLQELGLLEYGEEGSMQNYLRYTSLKELSFRYLDDFLYSKGKDFSYIHLLELDLIKDKIWALTHDSNGDRLPEVDDKLWIVNILHTYRKSYQLHILFEYWYVRKKLPDYLTALFFIDKRLNGQLFEHYIGTLLEFIFFYRAIPTRLTGDLGIDLILQPDFQLLKRHSFLFDLESAYQVFVQTKFYDPQKSANLDKTDWVQFCQVVKEYPKVGHAGNVGLFIYTKTIDRQRKEELMSYGFPDCFLIDLNDLQYIIQKALKIMKTFEQLASNESEKVSLSLRECEETREEILSLFFSRGKDKYALKFSFENILIL
ncbi:restriction endonuclease [Leptospira borgpetersenii]|uniref:restriction endonuclease n=1 Tax=Leptospira borgpetersenii TaxID=174 RepID=UPI000773EC4C|nr:restriction endonuclease [Leptospira borgpetersenii]